MNIVTLFFRSFDSSISSSTFANSNINQAFKIINDVSTKSSVVFGIDSENDEFDVAKGIIVLKF